MGKKPTGRIDSLTVKAEGGGISHQQVDFPSTKAEIESLVIASFDKTLDPAVRAEFGITGFEKIASENDLDCIVRSARGDWWMDLVEFVPTNFRGGHDSAPNVNNCGTAADRMVELIRGKAAKYASLRTRPWILMYATAWQYSPTNHEFTVVQHALNETSPAVERVCFISLQPGDTAAVTTLFPLNAAERSSVLAADIAGLRAGHTVLSDLSGAQVVEREGKRVTTIPLQLKF